eukprot:354833_1
MSDYGMHPQSSNVALNNDFKLASLRNAEAELMNQANMRVRSRNGMPGLLDGTQLPNNHNSNMMQLLNRQAHFNQQGRMGQAPHLAHQGQPQYPDMMQSRMEVENLKR